VIEVNKLIQILNTNAEALGQEINLAKSDVYFSRNMSPAAQEDLALILGVRLMMGTVKHMGLSSMIGGVNQIPLRILRIRFGRKSTLREDTHCRRWVRK
jgi:translation initiation factor 6 (eIF-6)